MSRQKLIALGLAAALCAGAFRAFAAEPGPELPLFGSMEKINLAGLPTTDATAAKVRSGGRAVLRVATRHDQKWPGLALPAPKGHWDLTPYGRVALWLKNAGSNSVTVFCRADNPGADGNDHCVTGDVTLAPGQSGRLEVELRRTSDETLGGKLFGMRGYPVRLGGPRTIDPANVTQLVVFVANPSEDHLFELADIRAAGRYIPPTAWASDAAPFFPFIDTFGQYLHKDWPGKTESAADLAAKRAAEAAELAAQPGPKNWDQYGGWRTGPRLPATGFFRVEKARNKWWLVDPEGRLFFSHGIDCAGFHEETPIAGRETWFQDFPGRRPEFEAFLSRGYALKGHYEGQTPECFSFADANLSRKYGPDWRTVAPRAAQRRLRSWGLNTIGNWSDPGLCAMRLTPYTGSIGSGAARMIEGSQGYWGQFPDVFDPSFARGLRRSMQDAQGRSAGDPWCIGYFSDNEMSWGDDTSIALAALKSGSNQPAKKAFIADLRAKYGPIAKLNAAWGADCPSWDALLQSRVAPEPEKARADLTAFYSKAAEEYFRAAREAIRAVAPHQLYLGCRFAWVNALAAAAAAKYCDVVSYNLYQGEVAHFKFNGGADVPLLVGEFHFGALDRGMFHAGLVEKSAQAARARAYKDYVESALHHPQFVGCHWFQYRDEPVTGRVLDEENYQIGFVDVADTPYAETIAACRAVGYHLYP
jgi:hypothetical protein